MQILLPEVMVSGWSGSLTLPRRFAVVASPNAVAAQTFKSADVLTPYFQSGAWHRLSDLFRQQLLLAEPSKLSLALPTNGSWIAFPYAISADLMDRSCAVWITTDRTVSHVRLYSSPQSAIADNDQIIQILSEIDC